MELKAYQARTINDLKEFLVFTKATTKFQSFLSSFFNVTKSIVNVNRILWFVFCLYARFWMLKYHFFHFTGETNVCIY